MIFNNDTAENENEGMKKILVFLGVVVMAVILVAAGFPAPTKSKEDTNQNSGCGYRIVEFGVAVNCKGDTVKLTRTKGFQQLEFHKKASGAV
jgi:hypothetical protein